MHGKPLETSLQLIGDNHSKLLALIMEPNPKGIKRIKSMTSPTSGEEISRLVHDCLS